MPKLVRRTQKQIAAAIRPLADGTAVVTISGGHTAIIDAADIPLISGFTWCRHNAGYAYAYGADRSKMILMHRLICKTKERCVDHINGNRLDNRRANLRGASQSLNMHNTGPRSTNTSGFCGVQWRPDRKKWRALIKVNYTTYSLGSFSKKADAIAARKAAEVKFGLVIARP